MPAWPIVRGVNTAFSLAVSAVVTGRRARRRGDNLREQWRLGVSRLPEELRLLLLLLLCKLDVATGGDVKEASVERKINHNVEEARHHRGEDIRCNLNSLATCGYPPGTRAPGIW